MNVYDVDNIDQFNHPVPRGVPENLLPEMDEGKCVGLTCNEVKIGEFLDVNDDGYDVGRFRAYTIVDPGEGLPVLYFCEDCACFLVDLGHALAVSV